MELFARKCIVCKKFYGCKDLKITRLCLDCMFNETESCLLEIQVSEITSGLCYGCYNKRKGR